MQMSSTFLHC